MELSLLSTNRLSLHPSTSTSTSPTCSASNTNLLSRPRYFKTRASVERSTSGERVSTSSTRRHSESRIQRGLVADGPTMGVSTGQVSAIDRSFGGTETDFPVWEKLGAIVRLSYGIGIYGAMAFAGKFICSITGVDCIGGFHPSMNAIVEGLGYAAPPIMALLFILDDEVVKYSPHARAIRDVEDDELRSFFYGMSPWQFILIITASSIGEELFYRVAVQGSLSDIFLRGTELMKDARGIASLTGMLPLFVPFAQAFAAVVTAALTGSLYYIATAPKDPTYVVTPIPQSPSSRENYKKLFTAWYQRRQMKKIYSPLLEGLLALYLGFEWIQTGNILAPMITHGIYSAVVLGHGLMKIHDHRRKFRHRIQQVRTEAKDLK
ncbi:uncharacterized protein LOC144551760 [Carex rostrata]